MRVLIVVDEILKLRQERDLYRAALKSMVEDTGHIYVDDLSEKVMWVGDRTARARAYVRARDLLAAYAALGE